ncbi:MAG TPA: NAD(P)/FAD-dependent oxidoreductase [Polyangiaceae bacterium]|jgi:protoporphyrinogen oxidase|nr:NAD(P)/FAD-dependent oxidoreductase [Polyangiaceae bacterium]
MRPHVAVIGAGPAGLTAAHVLCKGGAHVTVLEADPSSVGGISRTVVHRGFRFDIGGHRFFSKSREVEEFWSEILPDDMLDRPRSSRIYYGGKFFSYPLKPFEALSKLGPLEAGLCVASYAKARLSPVEDPKNFEDWVTNQFGERLFRIFFKTYTEKVWGMNCREISADWAAQRIKGLSLSTALLSALGPRPSVKDRSGVIKTLIDTFRYPRLGPGMMWEACADRVKANGGRIVMGRRVEACIFDEHTRRYRVEFGEPNGPSERIEVDHVVSSAPLSELARSLTPALSDESVAAAGSLKYRDFLIVALMARDEGAFHDNWIYIQDASVKVGRIQNFKSWSPEMVPDPALAAYGCEYFCHEGDGLWTKTDSELTELAQREMASIGLIREEAVIDSAIVRQPKAYPVYDSKYQRHVDTIRRELTARFPGLYAVGRNGMHKYNNQDHSMMTAMLAAKNILAGKDVFDPWRVNQDAEYHEAGDRGADETGRLIPRLLRRTSIPPKH